MCQVQLGYHIEEMQYYISEGKKQMEKYNNTPISERYEKWDWTTNDMTLVEAVAEAIYDGMDELRYHISNEEYLRIAQNFIELAEAINSKE